jgi:hypothetical protein
VANGPIAPNHSWVHSFITGFNGQFASAGEGPLTPAQFHSRNSSEFPDARELCGLLRLRKDLSLCPCQPGQEYETTAYLLLRAPVIARAGVFSNEALTLIDKLKARRALWLAGLLVDAAQLAMLAWIFFAFLRIIARRAWAWFPYGCAVLLWAIAIFLLERSEVAVFSTFLMLDSIAIVAVLVWARLSRELPKLWRTMVACWPIGCAVLNAYYLLITHHSIWNALGIWVLYVFFWGLLLAAIQGALGKVTRIIAWGITIGLGVLCLIAGEALIVLMLNSMQEGLLFAPQTVFALFLFPPLFLLVPLVSGAPVLIVGRIALQRGGRRALVWSYASAVAVLGALMFWMVQVS